MASTNFFGILTLFLSQWQMIILQAAFVYSHPILVRQQTQTQTPVEMSSDAWAQVIANVVPLMALVGEKNAKEYMRTASSWYQLLPLATAPLGILSILISAIRLSGPGFLKRLVGRDSERRGDALVELTPLSVSPATSAYSPRAVEIQPFYDKDRVAFVCGHIPRIDNVPEAILAFKELLNKSSLAVHDDDDSEIVLAIWGTSLSIGQVAEVSNFVQAESSTSIPSFMNNFNGTAALSYRSTGISPTQTPTNAKKGRRVLSKWRDSLVSAVFLFFIIGSQCLSFAQGNSTHQIFWMGIIGYLTIVLFTLGLLLIITTEVSIEEKVLPSIFDLAFWTFSDSRHAEHRPCKGPSSNTLRVARSTSISSPLIIFQKMALTTFLAIGIVAAYVVYYLSMRIAPWWVPLSHLGVIWLGALYRAATAQTFLVTTGKDIEGSEHWIGLFRNTVNESMVATMRGAQDRQFIRCPSNHIQKDSSLAPSPPCTDSSTAKSESITNTNPIETDVQPQGAILFVVAPFRTSLKTWSGTEDVMKVGLEMAKNVCRDRLIDFESYQLSDLTSKWPDIVRIKFAIYVPGLLWKSNQYVDFGLSNDFTLPNFTRHILKLLHTCIDFEGHVSTHTVDEQTSAALSNVLCGPITKNPISESLNSSTVTLRTLLNMLKDNSENANTSKYSLEQSILLPTIILACVYGRWMRSKGSPEHRIASLQKRHVDNLALSGIEFVPQIEEEFKRLRVWEDVVPTIPAETMEGKVLPRVATSGRYGIHNMVEAHSQVAEAAQSLGEDERIVRRD